MGGGEISDGGGVGERQVTGGNGRNPQIESLAIRNRINPVSDEILAPGLEGNYGSMFKKRVTRLPS